MQGNFVYQNPTKLIFGEDAIHSLSDELKKYGPKVLLTYGGRVITNHEQKLKIGKVFGSDLFPKFSILNPRYTFTVPQRQMVAGIRSGAGNLWN